MGESRRDLEFYPDKRKPSVPNNVGPGSYNAQARFNSEESKAPFGSCSRRRLNLPHVEMIQDMVQFRFIPAKDPKYYPNQTSAEVRAKEE